MPSVFSTIPLQSFNCDWPLVQAFTKIKPNKAYQISQPDKKRLYCFLSFFIRPTKIWYPLTTTIISITFLGVVTFFLIHICYEILYKIKKGKKRKQSIAPGIQKTSSSPSGFFKKSPPSFFQLNNPLNTKNCPLRTIR